MRLLFKAVIAFSILISLADCQREVLTDPVDNGLPPVTPINLNVYTAFDGAVGIEWQSNSEPDLKGYNIYRSIGKPANFKLLTFTSDVFFIDRNLEYDSTYYYKISAVDQAGRESQLTNFVSANPKNIYAPLKPQYVKINARNWQNNSGIELSWSPSIDIDIKGYQIYRSTVPTFEADTAHYLGFTSGISFFDNKDIKLLTDYYYRIIAVDRGGLKSRATDAVNDAMLNSPTLISPANNSTVSTITEFRFKAASRPANYKLVIQSNIVYGVVKEISFSSDVVDQEIKVNLTGAFWEAYKTYTWRVYTYTASDTDPNSFSDYFYFTYIPN